MRAYRTAKRMLLVRLANGTKIEVPRDWTDFESPMGGESHSAPTHLLDVNDLREILRIVAQLKQTNTIQ